MIERLRIRDPLHQLIKPTREIAPSRHPTIHLPPQVATPSRQPRERASCSSLYNRSWTLYKTTPFFGFDPSQFTTYEDELLNYLAANAKNLVAEAQTGIIPAGGAMASEATGHRFNPSFYGFDTAELSGDIKKIDFRMLSLVADDDDSEQENEEEDKVRKGNRGVDKLRDSLFVTLTVRPKGRVREQEYYYAVLLDQDQDHTSNTTSGFTYFNILLHKAPLAITRLVYEWFERKFDCRICRLSFQSYEFRRVVNESLEVLYGPENTHDRAGDRSIELSYTVPSSVERLKLINISIPSTSAQGLLASRIESSQAGLLEGIEVQCTDSMKIDFGRLDLSRAGCSAWFIASEGKLKIFGAVADSYSLSDFIRVLGACGI